MRSIIWILMIIPHSDLDGISQRTWVIKLVCAMCLLFWRWRCVSFWTLRHHHHQKVSLGKTRQNHTKLPPLHQSSEAKKGNTSQFRQKWAPSGSTWIFSSGLCTATKPSLPLFNPLKCITEFATSEANPSTLSFATSYSKLPACCWQ